MLFFRSEAQVDEWCAARDQPHGPVVRMDQLWHLAVEWYATRLTANARRPGPAEMRQIFAGIGLAEPFWDPESDTF